MQKGHAAPARRGVPAGASRSPDARPRVGFCGQAFRAHDGCLGGGWRRRTRQAAIFHGEAQAARDPWVSEWGNPAGRSLRPRPESIGPGGDTGGSETSQYPEEKKSNEIPPVAASERGVAQTGGFIPRGWRAGRVSGGRQRRRLERRAGEGDSPVRETVPPAGPDP